LSYILIIIHVHAMINSADIVIGQPLKIYWQTSLRSAHWIHVCCIWLRKL